MTIALAVALRVVEVGASLITAFSLLAIAIHEIGSNGWRSRGKRGN